MLKVVLYTRMAWQIVRSDGAGRLFEYIRRRLFSERRYKLYSLRSQDLVHISVDKLEVKKLLVQDLDSKSRAELLAILGGTGWVQWQRRERQQHSCYLAFVAGHLAAYCWVFHHGRIFKGLRLGVNDQLIGPCLTLPGWRGKGIYPAVLSYVCQAWHKDHPEGRSYITVSPENDSSIRGIEKAGFLYQGKFQHAIVLGFHSISAVTAPDTP